MTVSQECKQVCPKCNSTDIYDHIDYDVETETESYQPTCRRCGCVL